MKRTEQTDPFTIYMNQISKYKILTRDEEIKLAKEGDKQAREKLVIHNLRFVVMIIHKHFTNYIKYGEIDKMDLIQAGNMGLMRAVEKFDYSLGFRLCTYANWWIRALATKHLVPNYSIVNLNKSVGQRALFFKISDIRAINSSKNSEEKAEIRQRLLVTKEGKPSKAIKLRDILLMEERVSWIDFSIDAPIITKSGEEDSISSSLLTYPESQYVVSDQDHTEFVRYHISEALDCLNGQEKEIITRRWLGDEKITLKEIGDSLRLSRERIRQIETNAFDKIRQVLGKRATIIEKEVLSQILSKNT